MWWEHGEKIPCLVLKWIDEMKEHKTFWGQNVLVPKDFNTRIDEHGDLLMFPEGDMSVPACAKMPKASFFFDALNRQEPIEEDKLDVEDNLEEFNPITDEDLDYWETPSMKDRRRIKV